METFNTHLPPHLLLFEKLNYKHVIYAMEAAAYFDIATHIGTGQKTARELAATTGTNEQALYRLLRLLAADGIFIEVDSGTFANSDVSTFLRSDVPGSMRDFALLRQTERFRHMWNHVETWTITGQPVVEKMYGKPLFEYLEEKDHQHEAALFNKAMTSLSFATDQAIANAYDGFNGVVVDVGGGRGTLLSLIKQRYPAIQGVLFDLPQVIEELQQEGRAFPYELIAGSFFAELPPADVCLLKMVIHNWSNEEATTILQNCRKALKPNGRVLLCDVRIDPENNQDLVAKSLDVLMGLELGGRERTEAEFRSLLEASGLRLARTIKTASPLWIFEAAQE